MLTSWDIAESPFAIRRCVTPGVFPVVRISTVVARGFHRDVRESSRTLTPHIFPEETRLTVFGEVTMAFEYFTNSQAV